MGWRICDPVGDPTLRGTPHAAPDLHVHVAFFRIANRGTFCTRILLLWRPAGSLHERTVQNLVSLPDRSRFPSPIEVGSCKSCQVLRPIVPFTGSIPTSSEPAIMKSGALSCPPRRLSHGEAILYVGVGSMLLMRWLRMGACPDLSTSMIGRYGTFTNWIVESLQR